jgi:putative transposase
MGNTGVCWDNALAESFFATYKLELIELASWPTRARARTATVHWLEAIYNRRRRHSAIDMLSPVDYEERYWDHRAAAKRRCLLQFYRAGEYDIVPLT